MYKLQVYFVEWLVKIEKAKQSQKYQMKQLRLKLNPNIWIHSNYKLCKNFII
jgi:hypothetical protein